MKILRIGMNWNGKYGLMNISTVEMLQRKHLTDVGLSNKFNKPTNSGGNPA